MLLWVGLGNPGDRYARTRHNIGFMAVDAIVHRHFSSAPAKKQFQSEAVSGALAGEKLLILKPQTFMNDSGRAVGEALRYYKLAPTDVLVFYDELDLAPGKVKVRPGGGAAGHNGIRSLISHIGPDFIRVRMGIGHPGAKELVQPHVLGPFSKQEQGWVGPLCDDMAAEASWLVKRDWARFSTALALRRDG